jgi:hypothetical protein
LGGGDILKSDKLKESHSASRTQPNIENKADAPSPIHSAGAASSEPHKEERGEWTAKDGVIYLHLDDGGTVGWPMRYMAHAQEVVECHNAALEAEREKRKPLAAALEPLAKIGRIFSVEPYAQTYPDDMRLVDNQTVSRHTFITIGQCRKAAALASVKE